MNGIEFDKSMLSASTFGDNEELLFWVLVALTLVFTLLVAGLIVVFSIKYRRGARVDRTRPIYADPRIEAVMILIPLVLGLAVFAWGAKLFADVRQAPANAEEIYVIGKRWMWHTQHMNGLRENNELHIPLGKPIKLTMISQDVIHDFFVPAFRIHQDVIPGHYTSTWFQPTRLGKFHLFCAQFCGTQHSQMIGAIYVMQPTDYANWLRSGGTTSVTSKEKFTPVQEGAELYERLACSSCHGSESNVHGPTLVGIYGTQRKLSDGRTATVDNQYLRTAIVKPQDQIPEGYGTLVRMPEYPVGNKAGDLSEEQVLSLISYIRSLGPGSLKEGVDLSASGAQDGGASKRAGNGTKGNAAGSPSMRGAASASPNNGSTR